MRNPPATPVKSTVTRELDRLGLRYSEVAQFDLTQLSVDRRIQVRDPRNYARREDVERYAVQMEFVAFPPIVVTSDNWILDGNTRVGAAIRRKQNRFPALVLERSYEDASAQQKDELYALAATLNQQNGQPLTKVEQRAVVKHFLDLDWTAGQVGRAVGLKPSVINGVKKEIDAREKLQRVGMNGNGDLAGTSLRALGGPTVLALNDEPYRNLATLAVDAGLNATEIIAAAREIKDTGSDVAGITRLQQLRAENEERIRQRSLTGTGKPPTARQLRQHLGFVVHFAGDEAALVETSPPVIPQHLEVLEQAITVLQATLAKQRLAPQG